jgi:hypothetical protein
MSHTQRYNKNDILNTTYFHILLASYLNILYTPKRTLIQHKEETQRTIRVREFSTGLQRHVFATRKTSNNLACRINNGHNLQLNGISAFIYLLTISPHGEKTDVGESM